MERRAFISRILNAVAVGAVLDVDKLLWVPGAKSIFFLPPPPRIAPPRLFIPGGGVPAWLTFKVNHLGLGSPAVTCRVGDLVTISDTLTIGDVTAKITSVDLEASPIGEITCRWGLDSPHAVQSDYFTAQKVDHA